MISDLKTITNKGCKIPARKKEEEKKGQFCHTEHHFLVSVFLTLFNGLFAPTSLSPMFKLFLDFRNPWEEVMERSGLRLENFYS